MLGTLSESGTGKYAIKILPQYAVDRKWSLAAGYWRFSFALVLSVSLAVLLLVTAFDRRGMAKYRHQSAAFDGLSYTFGIEDSSPEYSSTIGTIENDLPDVVGNIRLERERWHFQFASFVNRANFTPFVGTPSELLTLLCNGNALLE